MNLLTISFKNIIKKPLSAGLNLVLFSLGIGLVTLLLLVSTQIQEKFDKNLAGIDLVIGAKGSPLQLILSGMYHVDAPTGNIPVGEVKPFFNPNHPLIGQAIPLSLGDSYKGFRIVGTKPDFLELYEGEIEEGNLWEKNLEVVLGYAVAKTLNLKIGDEFQSNHGLQDNDDLMHEDVHPFVVKGILKPTGSVADQLIITDFRSVWEVHDHEHEDLSSSELTDYPEKSITSILLKFKARNYQALNLQRNINENTNLQAAGPAMEINRLYANMGVGIDVLRYLAIAIILVSGLSVFISLFSSLNERKYELALMRVMGASPLKIFLLILIEGLIISFSGWILGTIFAHTGTEWIASLMESSYKYSISGGRFLPEQWWILGVSILTGLGAAFIPAWIAGKTDIHATLSENK
ncbi:MAG: hypothetical protein RJA52_106 [Bacteroidota bacterium]